METLFSNRSAPESMENHFTILLRTPRRNVWCETELRQAYVCHYSKRIAFREHTDLWGDSVACYPAVCCSEQQAMCLTNWLQLPILSLRMFVASHQMVVVMDRSMR
jgi:hypothetical protein